MLIFHNLKILILIKKTNEIFIVQHTHFYDVIDGQKKKELKYKDQKKETRIHERLFNIALMFKQIYLLSELARI